jgi:polyisoprenoid-binding protein YceI
MMRFFRSIVFLAACFWIALTPVFVWAAQRPLDSERSTFTIHVGKAGLFSMAGHEHKVGTPIADGAIDDAGEGHIWLRVDAHKLTVLPEKDQAEVQTTMQTQVLESDRFPEIRFESTNVHKLAADHWKVEGNLTLHGQTHPVVADVHHAASGYEGKSTIKQTDFGIQPVTVAGGAVKVKNELTIEFAVVTKP